jgi:hypothetical protein
MTSCANYKNVEMKCYGKDRKTLRKVIIKGGKGRKTVMHYKNGKCCGKMSKRIEDGHVKMICQGVFVKRLFNDCVPATKSSKRKTTRRRK